MYKPLLFAHIGMAAFKSGSSKYIFVEAMQKIYHKTYIYKNT